jgi:endonuclease G
MSQIHVSRFISSLTLFLIWIISFSQDYKFIPAISGNLLIKEGYVMDFNEKVCMPNWLIYELTEDELAGNVARNSSYVVDRSVLCGQRSSHYSGTVYNRGHLKPAADSRSCIEHMDDCRLISNITPQCPELNVGPWFDLEKYVRACARHSGPVYVCTGPSLSYIDTTESGIIVPEFYWKALLINEDNPKVFGFIIPNSINSKSIHFSSYLISIDELESIINVDLFPQLPDETEANCEKDCFLQNLPEFIFD